MRNTAPIVFGTIAVAIAGGAATPRQGSAALRTTQAGFAAICSGKGGAVQLRFTDANGDFVEMARTDTGVTVHREVQPESADWLLQVEPMSYDILLDQLPWGISMIQLPWMPQLLRVAPTPDCRRPQLTRWPARPRERNRLRHHRAPRPHRTRGSSPGW